MDKSKSKRKTVRGLFTRQVNDCEKLFNVSPLDKDTLAAKLVVIAGHHENLLELNQKIQDNLYDEEDEAALVEECGVCDEYNVTFQRIKRRIEEAVTPPQQNERGDGSPPPSASGSSNHLKNYSLPKLKLRQFSGELLDWLPFMSHFKVIHEDEDLPKAVKIAHLLESLQSAPEAYELVSKYSATDENYDEVMDKLINRYGRNDVQLQEHVRKLLKMQTEKSTDDFEKQWRNGEAFIRNLKTLDLKDLDPDTWLYLILEAIVPEEMLLDWQRCSDSRKDGKNEDPPKTKLDYFREFINRELEARLSVKLAKTGLNCSSDHKPNKATKSTQNKKNNKPNEEKYATAAELSSGHSTMECIFCKGKHDTDRCGKGNTLTLEEKQKKLMDAKACMKCLKPGHFARKCRNFVQCLCCQEIHSTIMCYRLHPESSAAKKSEGGQSSLNVEARTFSPVQTTTTAAQSSVRCTKEVLMKTLQVNVRNPRNNKTKTVRLLFDEGSQRSTTTSWLAKELESIPVGGEMSREILADGSVTKFRKVNHHELSICGLGGKAQLTFVFREKAKIGGGFSRIPLGPWLSELAAKGIKLNDVSNSEIDREDIDICIGSDIENYIKTGEKVNTKNGLSAWNTVFGWCLSGTLPLISYGSEFINMYCAEESAVKMWSLDVLGITDPISKLSEKEEEVEALELFRRTTSRNSDGRYCVKLPWKALPVDLPNNKNIAMKRLESTTRKLEAKGMCEAYGELFNTWEKEKFIEEVSGTDDNRKCHYLPHRPVFKESSTTPVRPVFDASCKTTRTPSLNDCLYKGPNCIELLPAVLMRFREKKIGLVADIRKAFQMIEVKEDDRDYLRFLWWESKNEKLKIYRHRRVVFGVNSSPFLLAAVINMHLDRETENPDIAKMIKPAMYVDNLVTSVNTVEEKDFVKNAAVSMFQNAKMDLRQWECTFGDVSVNDQYSSDWGGMEADKEVTKVLGMLWNKRSDCLQLEIPEFNKDMRTKREVLSFVSKFFDPLGLISPAIIVPKLLIQESWIQKVGWDSEMDTASLSKLWEWVESIDSLKLISIPRHHQLEEYENQELHTFTDASKDAYACVVFLRSENGNEVKVQLISSKARVAPYHKERKPTIPRLELMGCVIGARLTEAAKTALGYEDIPSYYWSDSSTCIAWIKRNENWGTFVGNRVKTILQLTSADQWYHVPGKMNPADLPSRGCTPAKLLESRWWEGPQWLRQRDSWPSQIESVDEEAVDAERRVTGSAMVSTLNTSLFKTFSYMKNVKTIAWWKRFIEYIVKKKVPESRFLTIQELREAERSLIRMIQLEMDDKTMDKLVIVERSDGIKHVKTSVVNREDTDEFCWPILLPGRHPIVRELIMECHRAYCHAGTQFLMGKLREKYWITQSRKTISNVLHHCVRCQRYIIKNANVETAPLPKKRVQEGEVFSTTGVDLAGPLFLKDGSKVWIVLFTCAVYRCVALDLVTSLDTASFIQALERFVSVYGRPTNLFSDNGTNFVGAQNIFKDIDWEMMRKQLATRQIQWTFNPPSAPWWGGFWERMVRSTKELLRRMLGKARLTFEELRTILQSVAATINNRPLTTVTEDPDDLRPLSPAMFLIGTKGTSFPEGDITADTLRGQYEKVRVLRTALNARFRKEYLAMLTRKPVKETSELKVGQIVLVGADNRKRFDWPLGRILELKKGTDGKERTVVVKVAGGTLIRPIQRIFPLELPEGLPKKTTEVVANSTDDDEELEEKEYRHTRSGRKIRNPVRYGSWNK